jgi:hypothetical protein
MRSSRIGETMAFNFILNLKANFCFNSIYDKHIIMKHELKKDVPNGYKCCGTCKDVKELGEFNKNKSKKDGYNTICRTCSNARSKKYYDEAGEYHKKQVIERNKRIINENRKKLFNYYKTHPCVDCGESNPIVLELDHINPDEKFKDVSNLMNGYCWNTIEKEIEKCEVRCANCHRIKTATQFNWYADLV